MLVDVRQLPPETRLLAAEKIRTGYDFKLPTLEYFNSSPCEDHETLEAGVNAMPPCRRCGIKFHRHQRVGVAWLYLRKHGLIADQMGTGKTAQAAGVIAAIKQAGEMNSGERVIVICRPAAIDQWVGELERFLPKLRVATATGTRKARINTYVHRWDVLVTGYQMFCRDLELMADNFEVAALVIDDVDALRNRSTQTAYSIKRMAHRSDRVIILTGTPLQKKLQEMHSILEPIGGNRIFGSLTNFNRHFVKEELVRVYNSRIGRHVSTRKVVGYQNLDRFIEQVAPLVLRRTPDQIDDVDLPVISPHTVFLDLHPAQRSRYAELKKGVLKLIREQGEEIKYATAVSQFLYGAQICAGLFNLGEQDGPGVSVKLDWVEEALDGDLSEEKVVIFCQFTATVQALIDRLKQRNISCEVIWGRNQDRAVRAAAKQRFWDDPTCRVLIGTSAIEQSLNLQVSRHLINVDQLLNPARMAQLAGRIRREGSAYRTVYVHNLLARDTQEEGYLDVLVREQALADHVWQERSQLYEALDPLALLQLIGR